MNVSDRRLTNVDSLRGLAALSVCWFHLTNGNAQFLPDGWLKASGRHGWLGVDVFFVISGFILPYAMDARGYVLRHDIGRFILKRVVRLDPPYLAAVALTLVLGVVSTAMPGYRGAPMTATMGQVLAHVGYLNQLLGLPWLSPVFWSLAIEFQFYIAIAILFPVLASASARTRTAGLVGVWAVAMVGGPSAWVVAYLGMFGCGMAVFARYRGFIGWPAFFVLLTAMAGAVWRTQGVEQAIVSFATSIVIVSGRGGSWIGSQLGALSYSLYLVHVPIGGRVVNFGTRLADTRTTELVVLCVALAASLAAAVALHRLVEEPARRWSASIRYRPTDSALDGVGRAHSSA